MDLLLSLVILLPLAGMLLLLTFGKRIGEPGAGIIATLLVGTSFVIAAYLAIALFLRVIERIGMWPFVIYRLVLGAIILALVY